MDHDSPQVMRRPVALGCVAYSHVLQAIGQVSSDLNKTPPRGENGKRDKGVERGCMHDLKAREAVGQQESFQR